MRLIVLILSAAMVSAAAVLIVLMLGDIRAARTQMMESALQTARVFGEACLTDLKSNHGWDARKRLAELARIPDVEGALLRDASGGVLADYWKDGAIPTPPLNGLTSPVFRNGRLHILVPIREGGRSYGSLYLCVFNAALNYRIRDYFLAVIGLMGLLIGLAVAFAGKVHASISGPIRGLAMVARRVSEEGDYSLRAPETPGGEMGILCEGFNAMLDRIQRHERERDEAEEQIIHGAFHDGLTGLPNRALFLDRLAVANGRSRRREDLFAVLLLDLDRFKRVVDSLGHGAGDLLLKAVEQRLADHLRPGDTLARPGGDEFLVLLEGVSDYAEAARTAGELQEALARPFAIERHEVFTTASIGIAFSSTAIITPEEMLRDAETAMYRAKAQGPAGYAVFDAGMHTRAMALLRMETDLRRALERNEFDLCYQPIVSLTTGRITGFEALARWRHPDRGLVPPGEFIPVAEETGLILPLGRWVLQTACARMRDWIRQWGDGTELTLNVNLSGIQFAQPDLVEEIGRILKETGLEGRYLGLEITESVVMKDFETAQAMLASLRARDVRLHIDDFGTGYSSLSYLARFPIDTLKIDRSFVNRIDIEGENEEIVRAILSLAFSLGLEVVAEGVERLEQLERLRRLDCTYAQGFLFARPLESEAAFSLVGAEPWRKNWQSKK